MRHPGPVSTHVDLPGPAPLRRALVDVVLVLLVLVVAVTGAPPTVSELGAPRVLVRPDVVVPAALAAGALLLRRRRPVLAWAATVAVVLLALVVSDDPGRSFVAVVAALFGLAVRTSRRTAFGAAMVTTLLGSAVAVGTLPGGLADPVALALLPWCGLAAVLGDAVRVNRTMLDSARERADVAERTREEEAGRRVAEERLRLSRELHDVIGHHLAVINAQAGAAEQLLAADPDASRAALSQVRGAAGEALRQTGRLVGVLRAPDEDAALDPLPRLEDVPRLVADVRSRGVDLEWTARGTLDVADPTVQQHGYRIVQEAVTNAVRHGTGTVRLRTERDADTLLVEVRNAVGPDAGAPGAVGHGLTGMRERVALCRGTLDVRREGAEHVVLVRIPLAEDA